MNLFKKLFAGLGCISTLYLSRKIYNTPQQTQYNQQIKTTINKIFLTPEYSQFSQMKLFALDAQTLGREVAAHLDTTLGRIRVGRFADGQVDLEVLDFVRGHKVYLLKSFEHKDFNNGIMELLLAVSACKNAGADTVTAIVPYFPYSSSPDIIEGCDFSTLFAADLVKMLEQLGCDQIVTLNTPLSSPKGFAKSAAFINIEAPQIIIPYLIHTKFSHNPIIIGSDTSKMYLRNIHMLKKTFTLFDYHCDMAFFNNEQYIGPSVKDRDVLLFTNLVRTGQSLSKQTIQLKKLGAKNIYGFGFHGLCSNDLFDKLIKQLPINELIMTNSIFQKQQNKKIRTISLSKLIAQLISVLYEQKPLSEYRRERQIIRYAYLQKIKRLNSKKYEEQMKNIEYQSNDQQL